SRRHRGSRPAFQARQRVRQAARLGVHAWWACKTDAPGLALSLLLSQLLRDESVSGGSRVHGAVSELPERNWLWPRIPPVATSRCTRSVRVSGRGSGG